MTGLAGWIGVDLDGTLAEYHGWKGVDHIGAPIAPMVARVKEWLIHGIEVRIFTARVACEGDERAAVVAAIEAWCTEHLGETLPVTNVKDYGMAELWDDRAVQVIPNTGQALRDAPGAAAVEFLRNYGQHRHLCDARKDPYDNERCDCGLMAARKEAVA